MGRRKLKADPPATPRPTDASSTPAGLSFECAGASWNGLPQSSMRVSRSLWAMNPGKEQTLGREPGRGGWGDEVPEVR